MFTVTDNCGMESHAMKGEALWFKKKKKRVRRFVYRLVLYLRTDKRSNVPIPSQQAPPDVPDTSMPTLHLHYIYCTAKLTTTVSLSHVLSE